MLMANLDSRVYYNLGVKSIGWKENKGKVSRGFEGI